MADLPVNDSPTGPHTHQSGLLQTDATTCPYCGQPISRKQYRQIVARIEAEGRGRVAEAEEALKQRFARDLAQAIEKGRKDAVKLIPDLSKYSRN